MASNLRQVCRLWPAGCSPQRDRSWLEGLLGRQVSAPCRPPGSTTSFELAVTVGRRLLASKNNTISKRVREFS
jgi:hypothetical protein